MDSQTIEKVIQDLSLRARLVSLSRGIVTVDLLDDRSEKFERHQFGVSEFCDLLLDWRQKLIERQCLPSGAATAVARSSAPAAAEDSISATA